jgi:hypothetical protein
MSICRVASIRVKSNAHFTCQECGSTEMLQAHHQIPKDDSTLICLCAECHSKKHPNVPYKLFIHKQTQPYWENKSASSLAKEAGVHPRTVYRLAKRLNINHGILSTEDEHLIKLSMSCSRERGGSYKKARVSQDKWLRLRELSVEECRPVYAMLDEALDLYLKDRKTQQEK